MIINHGDMVWVWNWKAALDSFLGEGHDDGHEGDGHKVIMMMMVMKVIMSTWLNIGLEKLVAWDFSAASSLAASTAFCRC